jgi:hypothetical protein
MTTETRTATGDDPNRAPSEAAGSEAPRTDAPALTFVSTLKPASAGVDAAQRNAVRSWRDARPASQVLLVGDDEGTAELAVDLGVDHVPEVARNDLGTPLLDDVLRIADREARAGLLCLLNGDLIVSDAFVGAALLLARWRRRFLMAGQCHDVHRAPATSTDAELRVAAEGAVLRGPEFLDYFVFPRGLFDSVPPFALGRTGFDNWLVWKAQVLGAPVVDVSRAVTVLHQSHGYRHLPGGKADAYHGIETRRNWELAGGPRHLRSLVDANYRLTPAGVQRNLGSIGRVESRTRHVAWKLSRAAARLRLPRTT